MNLWRHGVVPGNAPVGPVELGGEQLLQPLNPPPGPAPPLGRIMLGQEGSGSGATYRPHPAMPPAEHLDYMDKLVRGAVVVVLVVYLVRDPGRFFRALERRAGVR